MPPDRDRHMANTRTGAGNSLFCPPPRLTRRPLQSDDGGAWEPRVTGVTSTQHQKVSIFHARQPTPSGGRKGRDFRKTIKICKRRLGKFPDSCRAFFTPERRNGGHWRGGGKNGEGKAEKKKPLPDFSGRGGKDRTPRALRFGTAGGGFEERRRLRRSPAPGGAGPS